MSARKKLPSYRFHKSSGRALVTLGGRDYFLGKYDTPDSRERYDRLIPPISNLQPSVPKSIENRVLGLNNRDPRAYRYT
jgi:hypothetical protein